MTQDERAFDNNGFLGDIFGFVERGAQTANSVADTVRRFEDERFQDARTFGLPRFQDARFGSRQPSEGLPSFISGLDKRPERKPQSVSKAGINPTMLAWGAVGLIGVGLVTMLVRD